MRAGGRVVIVGGGVIGLTAALELLARGRPVTVVEARDERRGASWANAGWIALELAVPLPRPGLLTTSIRWLLSRSSPFAVRPRVDPRFAAWLWSFQRHSTEESYRSGVEALARLSIEAGHLAAWDRMARALNVVVESRGLLALGLSDRVLADELASLRQVAGTSLPAPEPLSPSDLKQLEPAVSPAVAGGIRVPGARHVEPNMLMHALRAAVKSDGGEHVTGRVTAIERRGDQVTAVALADRRIEVDAVLLAAGVWTRRLAERAGVRLPIEAGRGYALDLADPSLRPAFPLDLLEARVVMSPFGSSLRLAGTMELAGLDERVAPHRVRAIAAAPGRYLRGWPASPAVASVQSGLRPLTPDGLPVIGRLPPYANLFAATGHQMLGLMLAPATARAVADLIAGEQQPTYLAPFDPARFIGHPRAAWRSV